MTDKQKKMRSRCILTAILFAAALILEHIVLPSDTGIHILFPIYMVPYVLIGYDIIAKAARNIRNGQVFDENFLMMIATFGAVFTGEFSEAVAVMLFYQVGELFQDYAVHKSRQSITEMMDICPEYANIEENGEIKEVDPDDVKIGSIIVIKPGERIPLDGTVTEGESFIDTAALTGESVPRKAGVGDEVISGCVNGQGTIKVRTAKTFENSTVSKILELVENASEKKSRTENFITRFAKYYTPVVTIGAVILAIIPPLLIRAGLFGDASLKTGALFSEWIHRACVFLVISCPCALVISVPLGFFGGIGAASKIGVLVKGSNYLEGIADLKTIVFDKTGTLTKGEFKVTSVNPSGDGMTEEKLAELAAHAEGYSNHPIALSVVKAYTDDFKGSIDLERVSDTEEIAGHGIKTLIDKKEILAGNLKLMRKFGIDCVEASDFGTVVYVACEGKYAGYLVISDEIKEGIGDALKEIKDAGIRQLVMLTGDRKEAACHVAGQIGIDTVMSELLPQDKVKAVEDLLNAEGEREKLAFVGDGINDAPVLTRADIGIAMGSMGSDAAIEAADMVIMDDRIEKIPLTYRIARRTLKIVKQNIVFALAVKAIVLILGALGLANMWAAVFADVGVAVLAILNSMRTLNSVR